VKIQWYALTAADRAHNGRSSTSRRVATPLQNNIFRLYIEIYMLLQALCGFVGTLILIALRRFSRTNASIETERKQPRQLQLVW